MSKSNGGKDRSHLVVGLAIMSDGSQEFPERVSVALGGSEVFEGLVVKPYRHHVFYAVSEEGGKAALAKLAALIDASNAYNATAKKYDQQVFQYSLMLAVPREMNVAPTLIDDGKRIYASRASHNNGLDSGLPVATRKDKETGAYRYTTPSFKQVELWIDLATRTKSFRVTVWSCKFEKDGVPVWRKTISGNPKFKDTDGIVSFVFGDDEELQVAENARLTPAALEQFVDAAERLLPPKTMAQKLQEATGGVFGASISTSQVERSEGLLRELGKVVAEEPAGEDGEVLEDAEASVV